ncbi:hypothetical protein MNBD_GAMMA06-890 [hydrothermal vent metagenome]|uniref:Uncharacterized protein n=1 Tax=hydrothermal vent metagenome TaxID=652676 RepID=A0A3B0X678_9ZZZZ
MNKNNVIKLMMASVVLLVLAVYLNKSDNELVVVEEKNLVIESETSYADDVKENIEEIEVATPSENTDEKSDEQTDEIMHAEKSKFKQRCLDVLSNATESIDVDNISPQDQANMTGIFDDCIYEIEAELALTEKQFVRSDETMGCFNSIYEIRDYLLDLGTNAQMFSELPNGKDAESVVVTEAFIDISNDIITNGGSAMVNRSLLCSMDRE